MRRLSEVKLCEILLFFVVVGVIEVMTSFPEKVNLTFLSSPKLNSPNSMGRVDVFSSADVCGIF